MAKRADPTTSHDHFRVLIAGGGVAGWEAAFALQELAGERVSTAVLTASDDFVYRPPAIGEPFNRSRAERYSAADLAARAGAELICDTLVEVFADLCVVRTASGSELPYDALLVAAGAAIDPTSTHATCVDDARIDELLHGLVQDVEGGYVHRLAIVIPAPPPWPLPGYELALMAAERAWDMQTELQVTLLTPEHEPLAVFGEKASRGVAQLLAARGIEVLTSAYCEIPASQRVIVHPSGRALAFDRVIALPRLRGPALAGLPHDGGGFLPVDRYGRVRGTERVWAAGDVTDTPIKHGGIAARLADTAARSIAMTCGAHIAEQSFVPVVEGVLMTGGARHYLRGNPAFAGEMGESVFCELPRDAHPPKIAARYLDPHLHGHAGLALAGSPST